MAWLELHQTLPTNKKTLRLKSILKIKTPQAIGHLCLIWLWALDNAEDGDLSAFTADEIAEVAAWQSKDPQVFIDGLIQAGFLDPDMRLHDWYDYAGRLADKREANKERMRAARAKTKESCATHVRSTTNARAGATVPNLTVPNSTVPNSTVPNQEAILIDSTNATTGVFKDKEDAPAPVDPDLLLVMGTYQERINPMASGEVLAGLREYLGVMHPEVILRSFDIALDERKPTWSYINGILRAWKAKGIITLIDLQQVQDEFERSKQGPKEKDKPKSSSEILREKIEAGEFDDP